MTTLSQTYDRLGVLITDKELTVRSWDDWLVRATGLKAENVLGRPLPELFPELVHRGLIARLERVVNEGTVEVLAPALHGYFIPCPPIQPSKRFSRMQQKIHIAPLREGNVVVGTIITIEDVTERRERELDLAEQLESTDESVRVSAAAELATLSPSPAQHLMRAISDPSWRVRRAAVDGLAKHADKSTLAHLLRALREQHRDPSILNSVLSVMAASDLDLVAPLTDLLHDPQPAIRTYAALGLGLLNKKSAVPALVAALADPEPNVKYHAIEALGRLRAVEAAEKLLEIATSGDFFLAYPAIDALKSIGEPSVVPVLIPLLEDELLAKPVAEALGELGDVRTIEPLLAMLARPTSPAIQITRAILQIHERYQLAYHEPDYIPTIVRRKITSEAVARLLHAIDQTNRTDHTEITDLVRVLGWVESDIVDQKLASLLADPMARREVVEALVRHGKRAVTLLIAQLESPDIEIKHAAAAALGRIGTPEAVPALIELLNSTDELAVVAAGSLARIGDHRAFEALINLLGHPSGPVRQAAISALNSLGHPDLERRVRDLLCHPNAHVRESAAYIATYFGFDSCTDLLLSLCNDPDENVRRATVQGVGYLDNPRVADILIHALANDTPNVRAAAARAFANLPPARATQPLIKALQDPVIWVRYYAAQSLGQLAPPEAIDHLAKIASTDPVPHVRAAALQALGNIGGPATVAVLASEAESENPDVAHAAIEALGKIAHPDALPPLLQALKSSDHNKRLQAIRAIGERGGPGTAGALQWAAAVHNDPDTIQAALEALGRQATPEAIAALVELCVDPTRRNTIIPVLGRLGEKNIDFVAKGLSHPKPAVRIAIISALARMKSPRASRKISDALDDNNSSVRIAAINALASLRSLESERKLAQIAATDPDPTVQRAARDALQDL